MTKLEEIQDAILALSPAEQQALLAWLQKTDAGDEAAIQTALRRKQESISGLTTSRPYQGAVASARDALARSHASHSAPGG